MQRVKYLFMIRKRIDNTVAYCRTAAKFFTDYTVTVPVQIPAKLHPTRGLFSLNKIISTLIYCIKHVRKIVMSLNSSDLNQPLT